MRGWSFHQIQFWWLTIGEHLLRADAHDLHEFPIVQPTVSVALNTGEWNCFVAKDPLEGPIQPGQ